MPLFPGHGGCARAGPERFTPPLSARRRRTNFSMCSISRALISSARQSEPLVIGVPDPDLPAARERAWQPNLVVRSRLPVLTGTFRKQGIFATWAVMDTASFLQGVVGGVQALRGAILRPNICFLTSPKDASREADVRSIISKSREWQVGVLLFARHPTASLGLEKSINLWVADRSPDWQITMELGSLDLCVLVAYLLKRNWEAELNLITVVRDANEIPTAREFLSRLAELARLPKDTRLTVQSGDLADQLSRAPQADLNIFGMPDDVDFNLLRRMVDETRASCVFLLESGEESALA